MLEAEGLKLLWMKLETHDCLRQVNSQAHNTSDSSDNKGDGNMGKEGDYGWVIDLGKRVVQEEKL